LVIDTLSDVVRGATSDPAVDLLKTLQRDFRTVEDRFEEIAREVQRESQATERTRGEIYFEVATEALLRPLCDQWQLRIKHLDQRIRVLDQELKTKRSEESRLHLDIADCGGERLRHLPAEIEAEERLVVVKRNARLSLEAKLSRAGIACTLTSAEQLQNAHQKIAEASSALRLSPSDLPFASELIAVNPEHRKWEASIEQVLHSLARTLLVSDSLYARVSGYIDSRRLVDADGRGQRLTYDRVGTPNIVSNATKPELSLPEMLLYRNDRALTPHVCAEILSRFDHLACETVEPF